MNDKRAMLQHTPPPMWVDRSERLVAFQKESAALRSQADSVMEQARKAHFRALRMLSESDAMLRRVQRRHEEREGL